MRRGCSGLGSMLSIGILSAASWVGAGGGPGWCVGRVGSRAPRPLPSALRGFSVLFMVEDLFGQPDVAFGALGAGVVSKNGFAETGGLGQANTAGNYSCEDLVIEKLSEIGRDLTGQVGTIVIHGEKYALYLQWMLEGIANSLDGIHKLRNTFQREEFALDGNQHGIRCNEGIKSQEIEGGRAINQDETILVANSLNAFP